MSKEIENLLTSTLKEGMILAEDLILNNVKLLSKDTILNAKSIEKIRSLYPVSFVPIYKSQNNQDDESSDETYVKRYKETEAILSEFSTQMKTIFKNINHKVQPNMNYVRVLSENILTKMNDHGMVIKNIVDPIKLDEYLYRHSVNVAALSSMLGKWLNLKKRDLVLLTHAAMLHDIGKAQIPKETLDKTTGLTRKEIDMLRKHPIVGYNLMKKIPYIDTSIQLGILMHHERIDGSGYPLKLKDTQIHGFAKIIAIADEFDNMTSDKNSKNSKCSLYALQNIKDLSFSSLDTKFCSVFLNHVSNYYIGEKVKLSNGKVGRILKMNINTITKPLVQIENNFIDLSKEHNLSITDIV